jgi:hypothetical protein
MIVVSLLFLFPLLALANQQIGNQQAKIYNNRKRVGRYAKSAKVSKAQNQVIVNILYCALVSSTVYLINPCHFARSAIKLATKNAHGWIL